MIRRAVSYWPMLLVVLSLVWIVGSSESFQDCVQKTHKRTGTQSTQKGIANIPITLGICRDCLGQFVTDENPAITALATILIAAFTGTLWHATRGMLRASAEQGAAMERSIAQSSRAASAMEEVARRFADNVATVRERSAQQARAYIFTVIHQATYQEREKGLKFSARPAIVNTGHTPAYKIFHKTRAAILPIPLPDNFSFPLPNKFVGGASLGPQQHFVLTGTVDDFCDDGDVFAIKTGIDHALYLWGIVSYQDAFGQNQSTKFCQILTWLPNNQISGYFTDRHNEAT